jgi:hypothetical protein
VVRLIAAREPRPVAAGRLVIPASGDGGLAVGYPRADFDAHIEERPIDDPHLAASWGRHVYRITLAAKRPASQGIMRLEIRRHSPDVVIHPTPTHPSTLPVSRALPARLRLRRAPC